MRYHIVCNVHTKASFMSDPYWSVGESREVERDKPILSLADLNEIAEGIREKEGYNKVRITFWRQFEPPVENRVAPYCPRCGCVTSIDRREQAD